MRKDAGENIPRKKSQRTSRVKRRSPSVPATPNRGNWLRPHPQAAQELHDYVLVKWYGGDRERLSSGQDLFRKIVRDDVELWFYKKFPHIAVEYQAKFKRRLTGNHIVRRVRFMYVRYAKNGTIKIDGVRSNEYADVIR